MNFTAPVSNLDDRYCRQDAYRVDPETGKVAKNPETGAMIVGSGKDLKMNEVFPDIRYNEDDLNHAEVCHAGTGEYYKLKDPTYGSRPWKEYLDRKRAERKARWAEWDKR